MKKALLIGINYPGRVGIQLNGCVNDALHMQTFLRDACGYNNSNITLVTDHLATTKTIKDEINKLVRLFSVLLQWSWSVDYRKS